MSVPKNKKILDEISTLIESKKGKILVGYTSLISDLVIECKNNHRFSIKFGQLKKGVWCPTCEQSGDSFELIRTILDEGNLLYEENLEFPEGSGERFPFCIPVEDSFILIDTDPDEKKIDIEKVVERTKSVINSGSRIMRLTPDIYNDKEKLEEIVIDFVSSSTPFYFSSTTLIPQNIVRAFYLEFAPDLIEKEDVTFEEEIPNSFGINRFNSEKQSELIRSYNFEIIYLDNCAPEKCRAIKRRNRDLPPTDEVKNVLAFCRVSLEQQVTEGASLENQLDKVCQYTKEKGYYLRAVYEERGISSVKLNKRLGLKKMLDDIREGDLVVCLSVSRLCRNVKHMWDIISEIDKKKGFIHFIDIGMGSDTITGKLTLNLVGSLAQFERDQLIERIKSVNKYIKENGLTTRKPFAGENRVTKKHSQKDIDKEKDIIENIKRIYSENEGISFNGLCKKLEEEKIPYIGKNSGWHPTTVIRILQRCGLVGISETEKK